MAEVRVDLGSISVRHFRLVHKDTIRECGGATVAAKFLCDENGEIWMIIAVAKCSLEDHFTYKTGSSLALNRLRAKVGTFWNSENTHSDFKDLLKPAICFPAELIQTKTGLRISLDLDHRLARAADLRSEVTQEAEWKRGFYGPHGRVYWTYKAKPFQSRSWI